MNKLTLDTSGDFAPPATAAENDISEEIHPNVGVGYNKPNTTQISRERPTNDTSATPTCAWIPMPIRYLMLILTFTGFNCVYALRVNLSVAIIAMTKNSDSHQVTNNTVTNECALPSSFTSDIKSYNFNQLTLLSSTGPYDWSETVKSQILAAFFYGYAVMQLPGGMLADRFGSHRVFGFGILCTSVLTLLTPLATNISPWALFALRFLEGFFEGVTFPAIYVFWSYWAPIPERTRLLGITACGSQFGTIFAIPLAGVLTARFGWESVFYIFGAGGCVWCLIWFIFSAHCPSESRWITAAERSMIEASLDRADSKANKKPPTPWTKFARSPAVYAASLSHFGVNWGFYTYLTELPSYMNNVLKFNITQNGFLSALPYIAMWIVQMCTSVVADKLRNWPLWRLVRKNTVIRRTCNALGLFGMAIFLVCLPLVGCRHVGAVVLLVVALGFAGFSTGGYQVNHVDLASEYAGALMGITNTLATVPGFVTPAVVGWIAGSGSEQTIASWSVFFYISAGIFVGCGIVNCVWTSGERLPWIDEYVRQGPKTSNNDLNRTTVSQQEPE